MWSTVGDGGGGVENVRIRSVNERSPHGSDREGGELMWCFRDDASVGQPGGLVPYGAHIGPNTGVKMESMLNVSTPAPLEWSKSPVQRFRGGSSVKGLFQSHGMNGPPVLNKPRASRC